MKQRDGIKPAGLPAARNGSGNAALPHKMSIADAWSVFQSIGKKPESDLLTCITIVKDEQYFIRSFLQHYRDLGVQQFVFWDDGSTDGTREYLLSQPDCVVLASRVRFGEIVDVADAPFEPRSGRAGMLFRSVIPAMLGLRNWVVFADTDEFLFLPGGFRTLPDLLGRLDPAETSVRAALVEFYPPALWQAGSYERPADLAGLLAQFGCFDARPILRFSPSGAPELLADTVSMRMFRRLGVGQGWRGAWPPARLLRWLLREPARTPFVKTPLVRWLPKMYLNGNHPGVGQSPRDLVLASAHFKFTPDLDRRTAMALESKAYAGNSATYASVDGLLSRMRRRNRLSFLDPSSRAFTSVDDLVELGIMTIGDRFRQ